MASVRLRRPRDEQGGHSTPFATFYSLSVEERQFLLLVERGDTASVALMIGQSGGSKKLALNINCTDPLGRSALSIAIINENEQLMEVLLANGIDTQGALLLAIDEGYVEGVERLLDHEEQQAQHTNNNKEMHDDLQANKTKNNCESNSYTEDISPLILAAHRNNYEILKLLLERTQDSRFPLAHPHDVKCKCCECLREVTEDSLKFSRARMNVFRALASPSLMCLTSDDPTLTAFQLSDELKRLQVLESQFRSEYRELRRQVQEFATSLLDHVRTSHELRVLLDYDPLMDHQVQRIPNNLDNTLTTLTRLRLAVESKQKAFVVHPHVQQLLASIWYDESVPNWRRMNALQRTIHIFMLGCLFPVYSIAHIVAPNTKVGQRLNQPFVKCVAHSASYLSFLLLLAASSQRLDTLLGAQSQQHLRGSLPGLLEGLIMVWVLSLVWKQCLSVMRSGQSFSSYFCADLWNLADAFTHACFLSWMGLRWCGWQMVRDGRAQSHVPREQWHAYDPHLVSEGLFGAGMISSFLKLVPIFSTHHHLGPLQISLSRMAVDIVQFLVLFLLVLFAFGCGLNQLLWYYAHLQYNFCDAHDLTARNSSSYACLVQWRRFYNLFETSQSLFWASFGLVPLADFELLGLKEFTRFWALLMFGSYSVVNIIVLLTLLIAMMSNSFQVISEQSDTEWKFARTRLWLGFLHNSDHDAVPCPFNLLAVVRNVCQIHVTHKENNDNERGSSRSSGDEYSRVVSLVVRRYVLAEQKKSERLSAVTEDDVSEIRQDINRFRYEINEILRNNDFKGTPDRRNVGAAIRRNRRAKQIERRLLKGFRVGSLRQSAEEKEGDNQMDGATNSEDRQTETAADSYSSSKDFFRVLAHTIGGKPTKDESIRDDTQTDPARLAASKFKLKLRRRQEERVAEERIDLHPDQNNEDPNRPFAIQSKEWL